MNRKDVANKKQPPADLGAASFQPKENVKSKKECKKQNKAKAEAAEQTKYM